MDGVKLEEVREIKDLGIVVTEDLKPSTQCQKAYSKAARMLGMIRRTIKSRSAYILVKLYKTLVRPHLEYAVSAWNPHYKKDKYLLKRVQHRFTRMIKGLEYLEYGERLASLGLWTLEERRNRADLLEVYTIHKGLSRVEMKEFFEVSVLGGIP